MATIISHSPEETAALGEAWGQVAAGGLVLGLCGDLGAGKTQLVKGLARGLDTPELVRSPTFALVNTYVGGRLPLFHLDLYRLATREQIVGAGLEEYFRPEGVTVVEWAERWLEVGDAEATVHRPPSTVHGPQSDGHGGSWGKRNLPHVGVGGGLRWVWIEVLSPRERQITYEDTGA